MSEKASPHPWIKVADRVVIHTIYPKVMTDEDLLACTASLAELVHSLAEPYAFVVSLEDAFVATARQRKIVASHLKKTAAHDREYCAGAGIHVPGPLARGVVTAVFWLAPPSYPYKIFGDLGRAEQWARQRLAAAREQPRARAG